MTKKQICFSLVLVMLFAAFTMTIFATDNSVKVTLEAPASSVAPGDTVTVKVVISENTGFLMGGLSVTYDTDVLDFVSSETSETFSSYSVNASETTAGDISLTIMANDYLAGNVTETGEVAILTFRVLEGFYADTVLEVKMSKKGFMSNVSSEMVTDYTIVGDKVGIIGENHTHTEVVDPAVDATCTSDGLTEGKHCSVCEAVLVPQEVIPGGHKEVVDAAVEATCTTDGKTEGKHCSVCNEVLVAQEVIPGGHKEVVDAAVDATCTTDGKTEGKHCSVCNEVLVAQEVIPAGHKEVVDAAVDATCTTSGKTEGKHCSVCNEVFVAQEVIPAHGHKYGDWVVVKEATKNSDGYAERVCSVCNNADQKPLVVQNTGLDTGVVIIIVVAIVAVAGVAVAAFFYLGKRKG